MDRRCRLVSIVGMAGIGKTALSVKLATQIQDEFESVVWRSLRHVTPLEDLLESLIQSLSNTEKLLINNTLIKRFYWLINYFQKHRCLLIIDGVDAIFRSGYLAGIYREGYENYGELFKEIGKEAHQSCLLLTSQEKLSEVSFLEGETSPIRSLKLGGLGEAARHILKEKGLGQRNTIP